MRRRCHRQTPSFGGVPGAASAGVSSLRRLRAHEGQNNQGSRPVDKAARSLGGQGP